MKRPALHFILPIAIVLIVPFAYNACQGGLFGSKGFSAAQGGCPGAGLYKGALAKLSDQAGPSPFASNKVILQTDPSGISAQSKVAPDFVVKAGEKLSIVLNNSCLQTNAEAVADSVITKAASSSSAMMADLPEQAYLWTLDKDYAAGAIEELAGQEACLVGVSWNQTYKLSGFSDNGYFYQSHMPAIHAEESYRYFYNSSGGMEQTTGNPIIVGVIDTGVDWQHPDLKNNLWAHANGIGFNLTVPAGDPDQFNPFDLSDIGHGTHVSGMIGAITNNGTGIVGAMPYRVKIMPLKIFSAAGTTSSQIFYNAVARAISNGAHVLNMSLGNITTSPNSDPTVQGAISNAISAGITVVVVTGNAASGNGGEINGQTLTILPGMFATTPGVIGVGSFDASTGNKSYFSHYSKTYGEIAAPGAESNSTGLYSTLPLNLSGYGRLSGTSQAAPLVSAAAALTIGIIRDALNYVPTPAEVERLILLGAVKSPALNPYFKDGNRLDLLKLVQQINIAYPATKDSTAGSIDLSSLSCPQ